MRFTLGTAVVVMLALGTLISFGASGVGGAHPIPASSPVTGNMTGPTVLAYGDTDVYYLNASGGPAYAANGTLVGNLSYFAQITGTNTTGDTIQPSTSVFLSAAALKAEVTVGNISETLTVDVEITSVYLSANVSYNFTYTLEVVQPYVLTLTLVADSSVTVVTFNLTVDLDGTAVGTITVPTLTANQTYPATFRYATTGLSAGEHTFTVSLANEHGLVTFAGGSTSYSATFYVPGAPPNYTLWYLAGAVAFFGAIFIFVTRVAARRRAPTRK
jgi:hypothetical protein